MGKSCREILRSYVMRFISSLEGRIATCITIPQIVVSSLFQMDVLERTVSMLFAEIFVGGMIWIHFRALVLNSQRILLPCSGRSQVAVLGVLLVALSVVWPAISLWRGGLSIGPMACMAAGMALLGGWALTLSGIYLLVVAFVAWLALIGNWFKPAMLPFVGGQQELLAIVILITALGAIALIVARMLGMTEDDPSFFRQLDLGMIGLRPRMTGQETAGRREAPSFGWPRRTKFVIRPRDGGVWSRARSRSAILGRGDWLTFLLAGLVVGIIFRASTPIADLSSALLGFTVILPAVCHVDNWLKRWPYLEAELLRPSARAAFLKEMGIVLAIEYLEAWLAFAVVIVANAMVFGSSLGPLWLTIALGSSLAMQVALYGVQVWMMRYRSRPLLAGGCMTAVGILICLPAIHGHDFARNEIDWLMIAVAMVIGGLLLTRDAYHRWMVTELG